MKRVSGLLFYAGNRIYKHGNSLSKADRQPYSFLIDC